MLFNFSEVPEKTRERINSLAIRNRLPSSVLLSGGNEKTRDNCAIELAGAVICENKKDGAPCKKCSACVKIKSETHPDVIHIRPAKDRKTVSIDLVRQLVLDSLYVSPNEAENKVYIFHAADELSPLIQNSLLKTIEEPPPFAMFILLSQQREKLLSTVISRVSEFSLGDTLPAERKNKEEEISRISAGIIKALCRGNEFDIMLSVSPMVKNRALMKKAAEKIILSVRDACAGTDGENAIMLKRSFSLTGLYEIKQSMEKISEWAGRNANENLLITQFSSMLALIQKNRI
ncbi:MAG: hypothetical protein J1E34_06960 [Oscillospiraceae bacterium]|nr:hypothetical protein [Oscillospiraceae bacterium]